MSIAILLENPRDLCDAPPRGEILLDGAEHIRRNIPLIGRVVAWSSAMPPGNVTEMTGEERAILASEITQTHR